MASRWTLTKSKLLKKVLTGSGNDEEEIANSLANLKISGGNIQAKDFNLIECDIANQDKINLKLNEIPDFDFNALTIVITECVLVYMKKDESYAMLKNLTQMFNNIVFLQYDLVGAKDSFGREMIHNLLERDVKLYGYEDVPDVQAQLARLFECGFVEAEVYNMLEYYNNFIDQNEKKKIDHLEFMDEFEEWNLLQAHACFGYGTKLDASFSYIADVLKLNN